MGNDPYSAALSPDQTIILSGNKQDNSLSVIDAASFKVVGVINGFKEPRQAIVYSKDKQHVYVLNADLSISTASLEQKKITATSNTIK